MAALQESVRKAQAVRGEDAGDAEVHEMPKKTATTRKTATKAPAKKTAKKKTAKKKTAKKKTAKKKTAKKKTAAKMPGRGQRGA